MCPRADIDLRGQPLRSAQGIQRDALVVSRLGFTRTVLLPGWTSRPPAHTVQPQRASPSPAPFLILKDRRGAPLEEHRRSPSPRQLINPLVLTCRAKLQSSTAPAASPRMILHVDPKTGGGPRGDQETIVHIRRSPLGLAQRRPSRFEGHGCLWTLSGGMRLQRATPGCIPLPRPPRQAAAVPHGGVRALAPATWRITTDAERHLCGAERLPRSAGRLSLRRAP